MAELEQCWRWFGPKDGVTLPHVRQAGAKGIVTALHHVPNGQVWPVEEILQRKSDVEKAGLTWSVVESVPIHEAIKQDRPEAAQFLENYAQTIRNLAQCGIFTICYNFMPLLDWTRTDLKWVLRNGSEALRFDRVDAAVFDLFSLKRENARKDYTPALLTAAGERFKNTSPARLEEIGRTILLGLPGTVDDMSLAEFQTRLDEYRGIDSPKLRVNLGKFLSHVIPVAKQCGVSMAIHPDDPPFSIFGLPRIASTDSDLQQILALVNERENGITFCAGSLGALPENNLPKLFAKYASRIHFLHLRNVQLEIDGSFHEADHLAGSTNMAALMFEIVNETKHRDDIGLKPIPMRPDHGHRMLGDLELNFYAGYSAVGRLKGLAELRGLEAGIRYMLR